MNQGDLFLSRVRVALADLSWGVSGLRSIKRPELAQLAAMTPIADVPEGVSRTISEASEAGNQLELQGLVLKAFWEAFSSSVEMLPVAARLLVNPPPGLVSGDGVWMTLSTQRWLSGSYGPKAGSVLPRELAFKVAGETQGYFDDVTVFWSHGIDSESLSEWIIPGSTLTLCRPVAVGHAEWIKWVGLDLGFSDIIGKLEGKFKLKLVSRRAVGQVEMSIIGVEAK